MRNKEEKADRAKLFLPFDSLKGFRECLKEKERVVVKRKHLSQDACEVLNRKLLRLQVGKIVRIVYYDQEEYIEVTGMISKMDVEYNKYIQIVDKKIKITDIIEVYADYIMED